MLRSACVHKSEALFLFKKKPPQAPPKEGMCSPKVLLSIEKKPLPQPNYSLSPNPSPNGEGSENYCLQIKESLSPNPSPNGEGSEYYCLQIKGAFRWCEERLSS